MTNEPRLTAEMTDHDGVPVVTVHGEIDLYSTRDFEQAMRAGDRRDARALVVDLSDVSYIDSAGLSALLTAHRSLSERHADLYVVSPSNRPAVHRVLEITRLDTLIRVRNSVDETLAELHASKAA